MQSEQLERAIRELALRETEFVEAVKDLPEKKHIYKLKFSIAQRMAEGTVPAKEAKAIEVCAIEHLALVQAEARVDIAKALLADVREVLSARRSLLANERSEREFAGSGLVT